MTPSPTRYRGDADALADLDGRRAPGVALRRPGSSRAIFWATRAGTRRAAPRRCAVRRRVFRRLVATRGGMTGRVVAIVGPTATGKSGLGIALAKELGGEIVNADSMQLYRGMDVGTAKLPEPQRAGIAHHLLDVWDIERTATVADYQAPHGSASTTCRAAGGACPRGRLGAVPARGAGPAGVPRRVPACPCAPGGGAPRAHQRQRCTGGWRARIPSCGGRDPALMNGRRVVRARGDRGDWAAVLATLPAYRSVRTTSTTSAWIASTRREWPRGCDAR